MTLSSVQRAGCRHRRGRGVGRSRRRQRGFSLIELLVITTIISFLVMVAIPSISRVRTRARTTAVVNDYRVFSTAFTTYAQERGDFPAESAVGVVPTGMANYLKIDSWTRITPLGGKYDWDYNQTHFGTPIRAAIAINAATGAPLPTDIAQLSDIDTFMDDGNLLKGNFRIGNALCPLFVVQP